ncbi:MAG TPA: hypothetical protein VGR14_06860 [Verrucomicrobiae bacterium]|jgi:hypothetical protein|nr:hypothetical protein [Verrucomicrobiae bacterium]
MQNHEQAEKKRKLTWHSIYRWRGWKWSVCPMKWFLVIASCYIVLGSVMYPDWWRAFFWEGGVVDSAHLELGWQTVKEYFGQFWPFGGLGVLACVVIIVRAILLYGKHGIDSWRTWIPCPKPSHKLVAYLLLLAVAVSGGLYFRHPVEMSAFWSAKDQQRLWAHVQDQLKILAEGKLPDQFAPPESGVYLYLNDDCILRQYEALSPPLTVREIKDKTSHSKDLEIDAKVATGRMGVAGETEVISAAPQVSAPYAAGQLINAMHKSENVVRLNTAGLSQSNYIVTIASQNGVTLTEDQRQKLSEADHQRYEKDILKGDKPSLFFYEGPVKIVRGTNTTELVFDIAGVMPLHCKGLLKSEFLHQHLALAVAYAHPESEIASIKVYGFIEERRHAQPDRLEVDITPYAIW